MADLKQIDLNGTTYDLKDSRVDNLSPSTDTIGSTVRGIYINNGELTATSYDVPTTYAGSSSAGGAATSANKVNAAVTFAASGGASAGTTFDGSAAKTISYATVGAAASSHTHTKSQITDFPTIPTVNNGTLTIQKNGTSVGTFTANQSTNSTVNITVPTYTAGNYITIGTDNAIGINITTLEQKLKDDGFITCLIEGTKIAMADGSTKNIEDVHAGELIKSYDPTTKQTTTAMALTCEYTGTSDAFVAWITETGDSFEICGPHWIWNEDANCIFSSVAGAFKIGVNLRTLNGVSPLAAKEKVQHTIFRRHYLLISSNNLYYANNILVGHWDAEKYNSMRKIDFTNVPEEIVARWYNNAESYDRLYNWATDPAVVAQCIPLIKQINAAKSEIEKTKQQLAEEDYKDNKATEAFITAFKSVDKTSMEAMFTGIASVIEQFSSYEFHSRDEKRAYINQKEAEIAELNAQLDAAKLGIEDKAEAYPNISVLFINTVHEGDADFEALQAWAANLTDR